MNPGLSEQESTNPATSMDLFPTLNTTQEVVALAQSQLPIHHHNQIATLLRIYHNTLLKELTCKSTPSKLPSS